MIFSDHIQPIICDFLGLGGILRKPIIYVQYVFWGAFKHSISIDKTSIGCSFKGLADQDLSGGRDFEELSNWSTNKCDTRISIATIE